MVSCQRGCRPSNGWECVPIRPIISRPYSRRGLVLTHTKDTPRNKDHQTEMPDQNNGRTCNCIPSVPKVVLIFVPGYLTGTASQNYKEVVWSCQERNCDFEYIGVQNNNFGDIGNTTMEECLEFVIERYNTLCKAYEGYKIILGGHSMGGLLVLRMVSTAVSSRLHRKPAYVRVIAPAIGPVAPVFPSTIAALLPTRLVRMVTVSLPIAGPGMLYPNSPELRNCTKQMLAISLLRKTNTLYFTNDPWDLEPMAAVCHTTTIVHCIGDQITSAVASRVHAHKYNVRFVGLGGPYHQHFDTVLLTTLWADIIF